MRYSVPLFAFYVLPSLASPIALPVTPNPNHPRSIVKRQCGIAEWDSTNVANWNAAQTDQFLNTWWSGYLDQNTPNGWSKNFANLFGRMYLNNAEKYQCSKTADVCFGDLNCDQLKCSGDWSVGCADKDAGRPVYLTMSALQGMQDYFAEYIQVLDESQLNFQAMSAYLADNFFDKPENASVDFINQFFIALASVFSITGAYSKLIPLIAGSNVLKESASAIAALLGGVGNGYRNTVKAPASQTFSNFANLGQYMGNIFEKVRSQLNDMQFNLATGKQWEGKTFKDYAVGGLFLPGPGAQVGDGSTGDSPTKLLRQFLTKQFTARAINYIWRTQKIYITYTTDVDGSCSEDKQGPQDHKYCRDGDPGVYYLYWWHQKAVGAGQTVGTDSFDTGKLDMPIGADKLDAGWIEDGYKIEIKDIFEASIAAWSVAGSNYDGQNSVDRAVDAVAKQWAQPWDVGASWEGTFTIPVCNTGNVSYNVPYGQRIMPCNCGGDGSQVDGFRQNSNMNGYGVYDEQCTAEKQKERMQYRTGTDKPGADPPTGGPNLPLLVNEVQCFEKGSPTEVMVALRQNCQNMVAALGDDDNKELQASQCADGQGATESWGGWCRVAIDANGIHDCALTVSWRDESHGGIFPPTIKVGDVKKFFNTADAQPDAGGKGCHKVGTPDLGATFVVPEANSRWCLGSYDNAKFCTI
ncbi:hypothetical protein BU24DRAFT_458221 [Aaosphaeria arxii CBS 175.79]|uniref:Uncharacterized protein n=1 Tax=Aaosphaeria arxii CBS 175.79 TaxID=1450172 RepID=A0A6A5YCL8_9PLEO|nr:uncharacterized protein BU24DRAFT_458221 [Aaosphaeria arxii CBS 175.79]KAF2022364.1 hypothetical protein BU24DRAFT_458221 [Aaosphaeria arxii CBS 175.79]